MPEQTLYYVCLKDNTIEKNLSGEQVTEYCAGKDWLYIGTMQGLETKEKMSKLKKGERLK